MTSLIMVAPCFNQALIKSSTFGRMIKAVTVNKKRDSPKAIKTKRIVTLPYKKNFPSTNCLYSKKKMKEKNVFVYLNSNTRKRMEDKINMSKKRCTL